MTDNDTMIDSGVEEPASEPLAYSAEWWEFRTAKELRDIINRGFGVGSAYDGAVVETERRARETMRQLRENAAVAERNNARARLRALAGILAIVLAIMLWRWLAS